MATTSKPKKAAKASNPLKSNARCGKDDKNTMDNMIVNPVVAFAVYANRQGRTGIIKTITTHFSPRDIKQAKSAIWEKCAKDLASLKLSEKPTQKPVNTRGQTSKQVEEIMQAITALERHQLMPMVLLDANDLHLIPQPSPDSSRDLSIPERLNLIELHMRSTTEIINKVLMENISLKEKMRCVLNPHHQASSPQHTQAWSPMVLDKSPINMDCSISDLSLLAAETKINSQEQSKAGRKSLPSADKSLDQSALDQTVLDRTVLAADHMSSSSSSSIPLPSNSKAPVKSLPAAEKSVDESVSDQTLLAADHASSSSSHPQLSSSNAPKSPLNPTKMSYAAVTASPAVSPPSSPQARGALSSSSSTPRPRHSLPSSQGRSSPMMVKEQGKVQEQKNRVPNQEEDFIEPNYLKKRKKKKVIVGFSAGPKLFGAPSPCRSLFISRVLSNVTPTELTDMIKGLGLEIRSLDQVSHPKARFKSFRLDIPKSQLHKALNDTPWPLGVHVQQFYRPRNPVPKPSNDEDV